jgi:hypothetical protein
MLVLQKKKNNKQINKWVPNGIPFAIHLALLCSRFSMERNLFSRKVQSISVRYTYIYILVLVESFIYI